MDLVEAKIWENKNYVFGKSQNKFQVKTFTPFLSFPVPFFIETFKNIQISTTILFIRYSTLFSVAQINTIHW